MPCQRDMGGDSRVRSNGAVLRVTHFPSGWTVRRAGGDQLRVQSAFFSGGG